MGPLRGWHTSADMGLYDPTQADVSGLLQTTAQLVGREQEAAREDEELKQEQTPSE